MKGISIDFLSDQWITFYNQCKFVGNYTFNEFFIVSLKMLWYFEGIEDMAKKDEYIEEAYDELKKLSMDEQKRLEYEWREKAIRDYNSQMKSAERRGEKRGEKRGERLTLKRLAGNMALKGMATEEIAELLEISLDEVKEMTSE